MTYNHVMFNNVAHDAYDNDLPIWPWHVRPLTIAILILRLKSKKIGRNKIKIPVVITFIPSHRRNAMMTIRKMETMMSNIIPAKQPKGPASAPAEVKAPKVSNELSASSHEMSISNDFQLILYVSFLLNLTPLKTSM